MKTRGIVVFSLLFLFIILFFIENVSACAQSPCFLFNSSEIPQMWAKFSSSQFFNRIPITVTPNPVPGPPETNNPMNAAIHCILNPANTASSPSCTSAKARVMNGVATPITTAHFINCPGCGPGSGGTIFSTVVAFDWLRGKPGVFTPAEEAAIINWTQSALSIVDLATSTYGNGGNAALHNGAFPTASAGFAGYQAIQGHPSTTIPASTISAKIDFYLSQLRTGAHGFDNFIIEGNNYAVYSRPILNYASVAAEKLGYPSLIDQALGAGLFVGDLYMGSGGTYPACTASTYPTLIIEQGKGLMYDVEANFCEKGLSAVTLSYLIGLDRLHQTDPMAAKRGISRIFEIDNVIGASGYRHDRLSHMPAYILPALFYNDSISYPTDLDAAGHIPAAYHRDQENNATPTQSAVDNDWDIPGKGGLHSTFNKLKGTGRVGSLFINYDGYQSHQHGSASGSTEKFAGYFAVEVSPGRGSWSGGGHRLADYNHFLPDSSSIIYSTLNYFDPLVFGGSPQHNYDGNYKYHLEGYFGSGAESSNKRVWQMNCASCVANRFVGMISDPDDIAYVFEYAETRASGATTIRKRTHSFFQATNVLPLSGQIIGNGYKVEYSGNKGITRFLHPVNPQKVLPSTFVQMAQKPLYENQILQTTTTSSPQADWLYITELIPTGNTRQTPNMQTLTVTGNNGYAGVLDWTSNSLNKGFKDYIIARKNTATSLLLQSSEINIDTDARMLVVRRSITGNILKYVVFDATYLAVDGQQMLTLGAGNPRVSVSMGPGVQIQSVDGSAVTSATIFAPAVQVSSVLGNAPQVLVNGQNTQFVQNGDLININGVIGQGSQCAVTSVSWSVPSGTNFVSGLITELNGTTQNCQNNENVEITISEDDGVQNPLQNTLYGTLTAPINNNQFTKKIHLIYEPLDGSSGQLVEYVASAVANGSINSINASGYVAVASSPHSLTITDPLVIGNTVQVTVSTTGTANYGAHVFFSFVSPTNDPIIVQNPSLSYGFPIYWSNPATYSLLTSTNSLSANNPHTLSFTMPSVLYTESYIGYVIADGNNLIIPDRPVSIPITNSGGGMTGGVIFGDNSFLNTNAFRIISLALIVIITFLIILIQKSKKR